MTREFRNMLLRVQKQPEEADLLFVFENTQMYGHQFILFQYPKLQSFIEQHTSVKYHHNTITY